MTPNNMLSPDTQATLLLCGHFAGGQSNSGRPLTVAEYNRLAKELLARGLRPADLLSGLPDELALDVVTPERLEYLLHRGAAMALSLERWYQSGISVLGRSDPAYPVRLRTILKSAAPPILYVAGNTDIFSVDAICVVGSRDATESGLKFARAFGAVCAAEGLAVVSGDARGVDREAMSSAIEAGGKAIGILAESLGKAVLAKRNRQALQKSQLVLASPFSPESSFTVAHAMDRNKYLYAMSLAAVIVDSDIKGGTWSGAIENHKHGWVPAFVRVGEDVREGNPELAALGLTPLTNQDLTRRGTLLDLLKRKAPSRPATIDQVANPSTLPLFNSPVVQGGTDAQAASTPLPSQEHLLERVKDSFSPDTPVVKDEVKNRPADDLFKFFVDRLTLFLETEPRSEQQIAEYFAIELSQACRWLEKAHERHLLTRTGTPPRYALKRSLH